MSCTHKVPFINSLVFIFLSYFEPEQLYKLFKFLHSRKQFESIIFLYEKGFDLFSYNRFILNAYCSLEIEPKSFLEEHIHIKAESKAQYYHIIKALNVNSKADFYDHGFELFLRKNNAINKSWYTKRTIIELSKYVLKKENYKLFGYLIDDRLTEVNSDELLGIKLDLIYLKKEYQRIVELYEQYQLPVDYRLYASLINLNDENYFYQNDLNVTSLQLIKRLANIINSRLNLNVISHELAVYLYEKLYFVIQREFNGKYIFELERLKLTLLMFSGSYKQACIVAEELINIETYNIDIEFSYALILNYYTKVETPYSRTKLLNFILKRIQFYSSVKDDRALRSYWRFVSKISTIVSLSELQEVFKDFELDSLRNQAKQEHGEYVFKLFFESVYSCINSLTERGAFSIERFTRFYQGSGNNTLHLFSTKNINYQYMLSAAYEDYNDQDFINCDARFYEIFKRNFPNTNFIPLSRPVNPQLEGEWFMDDSLIKNIENYALIKPIDLNLERIDFKNKRKNGWLKVLECNNFSCIEDGKINVGISIGTGLVNLHRRIYNMDHEMVKDLFNFDLDSNINLVNLDYQFDDELIKSIGYSQPEFDLKNDMDSLLSLMNKLDFLVIIPNSMVDAASSVAKTAFVYDPMHRLSYWSYSNSNEFIMSEHVKYITGRTIKDTLENLKNNIHNQVKKLSKN